MNFSSINIITQKLIELATFFTNLTTFFLTTDSATYSIVKDLKKEEVIEVCQSLTKVYNIFIILTTTKYKKVQKRL
ncbi:hypothetical protein [Enterococcus phage PEF1]